jgi:hypothetical protein
MKEEENKGKRRRKEGKRGREEGREVKGKLC